jgi:hypothetical protein
MVVKPATDSVPSTVVAFANLKLGLVPLAVNVTAPPAETVLRQ